MFGAAVGSKVGRKSLTHTEQSVAWPKTAQTRAKHGCSQSSRMQDSEKKKSQHIECQGPQAKPLEASSLFSFHSSYQC